MLMVTKSVSVIIHPNLSMHFADLLRLYMVCTTTSTEAGGFSAVHTVQATKDLLAHVCSKFSM